MLEIFDKNRRRIAIAENACQKSGEFKINSIWYLTFALPYSDPKNEYCQPFNYVRLDGGELFRIMPSSTNVTETGFVAYQCEHVLATLIDTVLFGYHVVGNRGMYTRDCINYVLDRQIVKNWVLYECDFSRQFEYGWEQETLLSALFSIATPLSDYMWVTDTSVYPWRLSLKRIDMSQKPELYVRANWNMLSYGANSDPQQICTRLYPLGYGEGVNQLTIKSVNNGVPYLQSPKAYIDRYGIIERVWIDRRYEDPNSLKAAAQVMLDELQDPIRQYDIGFTELDAADYNKAEIGKRTRILFPELGSKVDTFITEMSIQYDDIKSSTITVANRSTDIASYVADMADRQRIEQSYAQGATQIYAQSVQANATTEKAAKLNFYIPAEMRIVNAIMVKIQLDRFRSYSKATEGGGATTATSSSGGSSTATSSAGGASTATSSSGGGSSATSEASSRETSGAGGAYINQNTGYSSVPTVTAYTSSVKDHQHSYVMPEGSSRGGTYATGWHHHLFNYDTSHTHSMSHTHTVQIPSHTHSVSIGSHTHSVNIPAHTHSVSIPSHTHGITQGIFEFGSPSAANLYINGERKTSIGRDAELDITQYLVIDGAIPRGQWHSIELLPDDLAYITVDVTIQGFIQSRGDNTV